MMRVEFTRLGYTEENPDTATLRWIRNLDVIPRVGDRVVFDDPEAPFAVSGVTWNMDGVEPDVWVSLR